ncbi:MAG: hypothetical protein HZB26_14150 [Candidatus Hydrogenedentes bacterium]|nr:hypothetical protein [Candidatus Hydrogenedentota bacterium]
MRRHNRKPIRNVILFATAVLCLGALIAYVSVTRKPVQIMPPETPEELAMRASPDNAYFTLQEAAKLIPKGPEPLVGPDPDYPQLQSVYKPKRDSLGEALQIKRPDDDPEFVKFIDACGPAIEKTREALRKPYYREPLEWSEFEVHNANWIRRENRCGPLSQLGAILVARGVQTQRIARDDAASATYLMDALRLGATLMTDGASESHGTRVQLEALRRITSWAHDARSQEALKQVQTQLREFEPLPPVAALEFEWRVLDNTVRFDLPNGAGPPRFVVSPLFSWGLASARRMNAQNRDEFRRAVSLEYPQFTKWRKEHSELLESNIAMRMFDVSPINSMVYIARRHVAHSTAFDGAVVVVALESYRRDHDEYPETLDPLVPKYLDQLPNDPFTGGPFTYRREADDYRFYSLGENGKDDSGTGRKGDDRIVHAPPEPET